MSYVYNYMYIYMYIIILHMYVYCMYKISYLALRALDRLVCFREEHRELIQLTPGKCDLVFPACESAVNGLASVSAPFMYNILYMFLNER